MDKKSATGKGDLNLIRGKNDFRPDLWIENLKFKTNFTHSEGNISIPEWGENKYVSKLDYKKKLD